MILQFSADCYRAAATCMSDKETRYYPRGVYVQPAPKAEGGVLMVATDGHRMALIHDRDGCIDRPRILHIDPKQKDLKAGRKEHGPRRVHIHADLVKGKSEVCTVRDWSGEPCGGVLVHEVDGDYLDWSMVLPKSGAVQPPALHSGNTVNPKYFADVQTALAILGENVPPYIEQNERGAPLWAWHPAVPHAAFIIMPMRASASDFTRPTWTQFSAEDSIKDEAA
jgi:hypothetical protein